LVSELPLSLVGRRTLVDGRGRLLTGRRALIGWRGRTLIGGRLSRLKQSLAGPLQPAAEDASDMIERRRAA
jgi:hypothetical protein